MKRCLCARAPLSESLAEEVHHVKEDKARSYLHSKLTDTVSSDMLAYQKHDDSQTDEGHEGLRRRHPLTHFQVGKLHSNCKQFCKQDIVFRFPYVFFQIVLKVLVFLKTRTGA